jgi:hypothetical protein
MLSIWFGILINGVLICPFVSITRKSQRIPAGEKPTP